MRRSRVITAFGWGFSVLFHVAFARSFKALPLVEKQPTPRTEVTFTLASLAEKKSEVVTVVESGEPMTRTQPKSVKPTLRTVSKRDVDPVRPVDVTNTSVDLTGVTLTGESGASWSSVVGNGDNIDAPLRAPVIATPKPTLSADSARLKSNLVKDGGIIPVVTLRELSIKPVPPSLNRQLASNYPPKAKRLGISGKSVVTARVDADGVVRLVKTVFESSEGFGAACQSTLMNSRWTPPRDKEGRMVATQVQYTCDFRVED
jgi:TonB family protein